MPLGYLCYTHRGNILSQQAPPNILNKHTKHMADSLQMCVKFIIFNFYSKHINVSYFKMTWVNCEICLSY